MYVCINIRGKFRIAHLPRAMESWLNIFMIIIASKKAKETRSEILNSFIPISLEWIYLLRRNLRMLARRFFGMVVRLFLRIDLLKLEMTPI